MNIRNALYKSARFLGDYRAARRGQLSQRIGRRVIGNLTGRLLGAIFKGLKL